MPVGWLDLLLNLESYELTPNPYMKAALRVALIHLHLQSRSKAITPIAKRHTHSSRLAGPAHKAGP
jgi:hypothetical protein